MPFGGGGVRPVAWLLLVAALAVGGVAVLARAREPAPAGPIVAADQASAADATSDSSSGARGAPPLPGSISLTAIPQPLPGESATGGSSAGELSFTDPPAAASAGPATAPPGPSGIPGVPLAAYRHAEQVLGVTQSACQLHWPLLAAIGRAESGNARGGQVDPSGRTLGQILGPRLDGSPGLSRVPDSDHGQLDGDPVWDRAVGPMQLLPSAWRRYAADGDGDGRMDPNDVFDAALTAGRYLCAGGVNLGDPDQLGPAVFRYRHSDSYVTAVRAWAAGYAGGAASVPPVASGPSVPRPLVAPAPLAAPGPRVAPARRAPAVLRSPRATGSKPARPAVRRAPVPASPAARPSAPEARPASGSRVAPGVRAAPATRPADTEPAEESAPPNAAPPANTGPAQAQAAQPAQVQTEPAQAQTPPAQAQAAQPAQAQATPPAQVQTEPAQVQGSAPVQGAQGPDAAQVQGGRSSTQAAPGSGYVIVIPESAASGSPTGTSTPGAVGQNNAANPSAALPGNPAPLSSDSSGPR